ncbi:hypothetical protein ACFLYF_00910 [Chloroflexota bacterium]
MVIQIIGAIIAIVIAVGIIMALMVWKKKREGRSEKANYRAFFVLGIVVISVSIVLMFISFILQILFLIVTPILALGLIYLIIGLVNRDKWKKTV